MKKLLALACVLAVTAVCYLPGLANFFSFDDGVNIVKNQAIQVDELSLAALGKAAESGQAGVLRRPVSMVSFALDYHYAGPNAAHFKAVNLAIHLVNGVLVFLFCSLLLKLYQEIHGRTEARDPSWIALAVAALWLLHPFNLTGVLFVVQRMTSLSALFTLAGLVLYVWGRGRLLHGGKAGFVAIGFALVVFTPLATLSKENGALLPLLVFLVEVLLLRWKTARPAQANALKWTVGGLALIPLAGAAVYVALNPALVTAGYQMRDFSLVERLMTEARVLWFYLRMILLPDMGRMGLHHDDFAISTGLLSPVVTLVAIAGLGFLLGAGVAWRRKYPLLAFGIGFFFIGHLLESTVIPLEIAFEHRNYLPMLGVLLPLAYYAMSRQYHPSSARLRMLALMAMLILFAGLTALRAVQWSDPLQLRMLEAERHPRSIRAQTELAGLYNYLPARSPDEALQYYLAALTHYQQAADISEASLSGPFGMLVTNAERSMPVSPEVILMLEQRLAKAPLNPPNVNSIIGASRCIRNGKCVIDPEVFDRLARAAAANPAAGGYKQLVMKELEMTADRFNGRDSR